MKPQKYIKSAALLLIVLLLSGCEDFLDRYPKTSVSGKDIFSSIETAEAGLIGLYSTLQDGRLTGRGTLVRGDLKGPDFFLLTGGGQYFVPEYNYQENVTNHGQAGYIWAAGYETIKDCNVFLDGLKGIDDSDKKSDMIAQAKTIKAIAYIDMMKTFCYPPSMSAVDSKYSMGLPLVINKEDNVSAIEEGPMRAPLTDLFEHIEGLLEDALVNIDPSRSTGIFISQYAISGLLAEVYLYQEKWTEAAAAAIDAAAGGTMIPREEFLTEIREDANNETLFEIMYTLTDNLADRMPGYWMNKTVNENNRHDIYSVGYGDVGASDAFINLVNENPNDIRIELFHEDKLSTAAPDQDPLIHGVDGYSERYYWKYIGGKDGSVFLHNTPVIRLPEVLLIAAEAYSETPGQETMALNYLNQVYSNRTGTTLTGLTGQSLRDAIFNERRRELALEGHSIWDYLRKNRSFTRDASHFTVVTIDPTTPAGRDAELFHKVVSPIPITEMDANPNIRDQQNPGYAPYQTTGK
jgi:hypothetical protein